MDKELCSFPVWERRKLSSFWLSISEKAVVLFESSFDFCVWFHTITNYLDS